MNRGHFFHQRTTLVFSTVLVIIQILSQPHLFLLKHDMRVRHDMLVQMSELSLFVRLRQKIQ
jgi:hypothetical protein